MPRRKQQTSEYMFDMSTFDDYQLAALYEVKEGYDQAMYEGVHPDMMLDMKKLRFARWLADHNFINEFGDYPMAASNG